MKVYVTDKLTFYLRDDTFSLDFFTDKNMVVGVN